MQTQILSRLLINPHPHTRARNHFCQRKERPRKCKLSFILNDTCPQTCHTRTGSEEFESRLHIYAR